MQPRESGKTRSQRIEIDYYRHRGGLYYLKWALVLVALLASGGYAAYVIASGNSGRHLSTGPLSLSHASFEDDCSACHEDFTPIGADAFRPDPAASFAHIEAACQDCHQVGDHFREVMTADAKDKDQNCAACHSDHQGRAHDLLAVANGTCTQCHAALSSICQSSHTPRIRTKVTEFTLVGHGDFGSLAKGDSGRVRFDHAQHMLPGQVNPGDRGGFTIAMLEPEKRQRYRRSGQDDDALVSLDCASCHDYAGNPDPSGSLTSDQELGRYMAPVSFEEHCAACHSINPSGRGDDTLPLPHAAPWAEIELLVGSKISGAMSTGKMRRSRDDTQTEPRPGDGTGRPAPDTASVSAPTVASAVALVRQQCLNCHDEASITDESIAALREDTADPLIPPRWFQIGLYDHAAHRKLDCRYCHEAAYPVQAAVATSPVDHDTVMIAGIESCTGCHRDPEAKPPAALAADRELLGGQPTWASDACTLCHRYHTEPARSEAEGGRALVILEGTN